MMLGAHRMSSIPSSSEPILPTSLPHCRAPVVSGDVGALQETLARLFIAAVMARQSVPSVQLPPSQASDPPRTNVDQIHY